MAGGIFQEGHGLPCFVLIVKHLNPPHFQATEFSPNTTHCLPKNKTKEEFCFPTDIPQMMIHDTVGCFMCCFFVLPLPLICLQHFYCFSQCCCLYSEAVISTSSNYCFYLSIISFIGKKCNCYRGNIYHK